MSENLWRKHDLIKDQLFVKNEPRATFVGYPGDSPFEGKKRLYLDIEFNTYIEIDEEDILLTQPVGSDVIEQGGVRIWVYKYSEVIYGGSFTQKISVKSLQEEIRSHRPGTLIPGLMGIYGPDEQEEPGGEGGFGLRDRH